MRCSHLSFLLVLAAAKPAVGQTLIYDFMGDSVFFGRRVAGLGDVDGDGIGDIGVLEPHEAMNPAPGYARVYSGATGSLITELLPQSGTLLTLLHRAGDLDGDGSPDIFLFDGALVGRSIVSGTNLVTMLVTGADLQALECDVNRDGCDDVLGSLAADASQSPPLSGGIGLFSGATGQLIYSISGTVPLGLFGATFDVLGDLDGDGIRDFVVGEHGPNMLGQLQPGRVHVISGADGVVIHTFDAPGQALSYGSAVAAVDDIDGDLISDFLIHAPIGVQGLFQSNPAGGLGQVFLHSGATGNLLFTFDCPVFECSFNNVIDSSCGDIDGDGRGDFSSPGLADATGPPIVTVVYSGRTFEPLVAVPRPPTANVFPRSDGVGDLDGDDAAEMVFGTFGIAPPTLGGGAFVFSLAPAGVTAHGAGSPGVDGRVPRIGSSGSVAPDGGLVVNLSSVPPDVTAVLVVGISDSNWQGSALPLDISGSGAVEAELRVSPDLCLVNTTEAFGPLNAWACEEFTFPNDPALSGFSFHLQWIVLEPPASIPPFSATKALRVQFPM